MNDAKCFDVMDEDLTPEIYTLLFSDVFVELMGNDMCYRIRPFRWQVYEGHPYIGSSELKWKQRLERGYRNCYFDEEAMKNLCENPITCEEALNRFQSWLTEKGVTPDDNLFVKIWW